MNNGCCFDEELLDAGILRDFTQVWGGPISKDLKSHIHQVGVRLRPSFAEAKDNG